MQDIADSEFGIHCFIKNYVFLLTEPAGTDICSMAYRDMKFRIYLSFFSWKENILCKQHIVHWCCSCAWYVEPHFQRECNLSSCHKNSRIWTSSLVLQQNLLVHHKTSPTIRITSTHCESIIMLIIPGPDKPGKINDRDILAALHRHSGPC